MDVHDIIVHRANSLFNQATTLGQVEYYIQAGFKKLEIDIYAVTPTTYLFCHPNSRSDDPVPHTLDDGFLTELVAKNPDVEWMVDPKCLDLDEMPKDFVQFLIDTFPGSVLTAGQAEILEFAHSRGMRTNQFFRDYLDASLSYEPYSFSQQSSTPLARPKEKTIVHCNSVEEALRYKNDGVKDVMVDGHLLVEFAKM